MSKGYLIVNVYLETIAEPVEGATVIITGENYERTYSTNSDGKTETIELDAPNVEYSLKPEYTVKPYSTYDLTVTKPGLNTVIIKKVEILPGETSFQDVYMKADNSTDIINLPEHELWEPSPGKGEQQFTENPDMLRILPRVIIPEYVIVHDGVPTATAARHVVPFTDYIKNVASSEIFSTWPLESLRANVHAIVSFTLNRIFTEWYPSRGFNFTITASPAFDQKYTHNRTIFQSISNVVDEMFRYYIRLSGTTFPFFAQYNDGVKTNIPGRLSQWGSVEQANRGLNAIQILRHFYTPNLGLFVAEEIVGLPTSFPGFNLRVGSCGNEVLAVQTRLNRIRANYPGIPAISPANGEFGESTRRSVETFQRVFNLPVTGVIDIATWLRITYLFTAVARLQQGAR